MAGLNCPQQSVPQPSIAARSQAARTPADKVFGGIRTLPSTKAAAWAAFEVIHVQASLAN